MAHGNRDWVSRHWFMRLIATGPHIGSRRCGKGVAALIPDKSGIRKGELMLFHTFHSREERREFGGSYFIEIQYCNLALGCEIKEKIAVDAIRHWQNDSLYIYGDDDNEFMSYYGEIFTGGIYNNGKSGVVDLCGINYYSQEQTRRIMERVKKEKPLDHQVLLRWLEKADKPNGFYVLGL